MSLQAECPGRCCAVFTLSHSAQEKLASPAYRVPEQRMIRAMVVPLGWIRATIRYWRLGYGWRPRKHWSMRGVMFTCRFWNTRTRRCRVYGARPHLCRSYGTPETPCQHGCGAGCAAT